MTDQTKRDVLRELETRLDNATRNLDLLIDKASGSEVTRLRGKREGVWLALSYVQEAKR